MSSKVKCPPKVGQVITCPTFGGHFILGYSGNILMSIQNSILIPKRKIIPCTNNRTNSCTS